MKGFAIHYSFEFLSGIRNRTLLLMNYLMPLGFYLLMGSMMPGINPFFADQMIPAMAIFAILSGTIMGLPTPLVEAREGQVLRTYRVHGVPAPSLLAIPALSTSVHVGGVCAIIAATAPLLFGVEGPTSLPAYASILAAFTFAVAGMGSLIGVVSSGSKVAILWQQLIYLPSMILGGLMIPLDILPDIFFRIAHLLPTTYGMQALMGAAFDSPTPYPPLGAVLVLLVGGAVAFGLAHYLFSWDDRNARRRAHPALALLAFLPYIAGALLLLS